MFKNKETEMSGPAAGNSEEWLNLSLGRNVHVMAADQDFQAKPPTNKVFSCNFCKRKFYNLQALGGHQNAHRRERGAVRRFLQANGKTMSGLSANNPIVHSLGVQPHSLVHKLSGAWDPTVARFNDANEWFGLARARAIQLSEEQTSLKRSTVPPKVDLTLRLS